jgi:hypothetical protein
VGPALAASYTLWPAAHLVNFALVPPQHRLLYINIIGVRAAPPSTHAFLFICCQLAGCCCGSEERWRRAVRCVRALCQNAIANLCLQIVCWHMLLAAVVCAAQVVSGVYLSHVANSSAPPTQPPAARVEGGGDAATAAAAGYCQPPPADEAVTQAGQPAKDSGSGGS